MCGIAGILTTGAVEGLRDEVGRMTQRLHHRGPDAHGVYVDGPAALGHARLAIIDLSERGAQPMVTPDGRFAIAYNGEVYNFAALRATLAAAGVPFRSDSDTEVVLQAFAMWGVDACARFNGMFAFAVWDRVERRLTLARDRFGIKPLYWRQDADRLMFGSEIKALAACDGFDARLDHAGLGEYLYYGNALGANTLFAGCHKLPTGHCLEIQPGQPPRIRAWWSLADVREHDMPDAELLPVLRRTLQEAVGRHLVADVPVALFLSGGLDSSTICALASRAYSGRLKTISVEFGGSSHPSELAAARLVATTFGTEHEEVHLTFSNLADVLNDIGRAHDQPFGDAANVPLYILSRDVASSAKVVLQGDGGDEIFGGYRRYGLLRQLRRWACFARLAPVPRALAARSNAARRLRRMQDALGRASGGERFARLLTEEWEDGGLGALLRPDAKARLRAFDPFAAYHRAFPAVSRLDAAQGMLWTDTQILLPDIFLEKVDRSTMANSVEVRVPFLDTELTDLVMGLPSAHKLEGSSKALLRKAMSGILPAQILTGPKLGFGVPYGDWIAGPLADFTRDRLLAPAGLVSQLFDRRQVEVLCDEHMNKGISHAFMLYKLLMLALWGQQYRVDAG